MVNGIARWAGVVAAACVCAAGAWAQPLDTNLVMNGGAEDGAASADGTTLVDVPGWQRSGAGFTVVQYGTPGGFPDGSSPGPANRGSKFFVGGPAAVALANQSIVVSGLAGVIDSELVGYAFSAFLGGKGMEEDNAILTLVFNDANGSSIGTVNLVGPSAAQRGGVTGMLYRSRTGAVPAGTRSVQLALLMSGMAGGLNDGYADAVSLVLTRRCAPCVADFNNSGGTPDDADVAGFFGAWNEGQECADANGSGGTPDDADIARFFQLWSEGGC